MVTTTMHSAKAPGVFPRYSWWAEEGDLPGEPRAIGDDEEMEEERRL
ncbi:MAG: hypothetical protein ACLSAF_20060 [Intestinimonas sp.]